MALDPIDESDIDELLEHPAWRHVKRRIESVLENERHNCERAADPLTVYRAQGAVAALRAALNIPEILRGDVKKG